MQKKLEAKLFKGQSVTVAQIANIGFADPYDPIRRMRNRGHQIQRTMKQTRSGSVSTYSLA